MGLPIVAIVGRPNVGKSSLFNALVGRRTSIVEPTPGVTRDRVSAICQIDDAFVELVDTGGYGIEDVDDLTEHVERQIMFAIRQAALILFVVDVRDGVVPLDQTMARLLREHHERVHLLANKTDAPTLEPQAAEFHQLGYGHPLCVSATQKHGLTELRAVIVGRLKATEREAPAEPVMKIAIVGRRNVGKSTFINALAGEQRVIVSEVPGTTRDAVDVRFELEGRTFVAIDTAGVRKKSKIADSIEFYSFIRVQSSIQRADVVVLMFDASEPTVMVDKKLSAYLLESYKPVVIVVNKWDLAKGRASTDDYGSYLTKTLPGLDFAPVCFVSANSGRNVMAAVETASSVFKQYRTRVSTGRLNRVVSEALAVRGPSAKRGSARPKVYFATQVADAPPTIALFVNRVSLISDNYVRFLLNRMREELPFGEVPIRLAVRSHHRGSAPYGEYAGAGP